MKTLAQLTDSMNTRAAVYQLAQADHQRIGSGETYRALEAARVDRRKASDAVDAAEAPVVTECAYCGHDVQLVKGEHVAPVDDDEAWAALAREHGDLCEWIASRAHRVF